MNVFLCVNRKYIHFLGCRTWGTHPCHIIHVKSNRSIDYGTHPMLYVCLAGFVSRRTGKFVRTHPLCHSKWSKPGIYSWIPLNKTSLKLTPNRHMKKCLFWRTLWRRHSLLFSFNLFWLYIQCVLRDFKDVPSCMYSLLQDTLQVNILTTFRSPVFPKGRQKIRPLLLVIAGVNKARFLFPRGQISLYPLLDCITIVRARISRCPTLY